LSIVIAVSGPPASGKSTYAKIISKEFGLRLFSTGSAFREIAKKLNLSLEEFHSLAEKNYEYDIIVDKMALEEAKKGNIVVEGHLACWLLKDIADLKIYVTAPLNERIKRLMEREGKSYEKAKEEILSRERSNKKRYLEIYGINIDDFSSIDIMINTALFDIDDIAKILISIIKTYLSKKNASISYSR
jgi:cytidylate kinase, putative